MIDDNVKISFDALLTMVVAESDNRDLQDLPSLNQMNRQYRPTQKMSQQIEALIKKVKQKEARHRFTKRIKRALIFAATSLSLFTCMMLPVNAVQEAVVSTIIEWYSEFSTVFFISSHRPQKTLEHLTIEHTIEGFSLTESIDSLTNYYVAVFQDQTNNTYSLHVVPANANHGPSIDNEDVQHYTLKFDNYSAIWIAQDNGGNVLVWENTGYTFTLTGTQDVKLSDLIYVAQSISF